MVIYSKGLDTYPIMSVTCGKFSKITRNRMHADKKSIFGRTQELQALQKQLRQTGRGRGGVVLLSGQSGIGKSTLLQHALSDGDAQVVQTQVYEDAALPYAPVIQALRQLLPYIEQENLQLKSFLGVILPELEQSTPDSNRDTLFAAIKEVFQVYTKDRPLVFVIEDLHWADDSTMEALLPLALEARQSPLTIIGTYRNEYLPKKARLRWFRNELRRHRMLLEIGLELLNEDDCRQLMEHITGGPVHERLSRLIFEQTQGLPLFIQEITKVLVSKSLLIKENGVWCLTDQQELPVPDSIRDAVALQLDGLSPAAREKLEFAAAYGMVFDLNFLVETTGGDAGMDELLQQQIIRENHDGTGVFQHYLTKEAIKGEILWSKRRSIYRCIAEYLEQHDTELERRGKFWLQAGEHEQARGAFITSVQQYCKMHAHREAAQAAHQALELWPKGKDEPGRVRMLEQLANCTQISGQLHDSIVALRELAASDPIKNDARRLAEVHRSLAIAYGLQNTWLQYTNSRLLAAELFEQADLPGEAAKEWLAIANRYLASFEINAALDATGKSISLAKTAKDHGTQARAMGVHGYTLSMQGKFEAAREMANEAINLALAHNEKEAAADAYRRLGGVYEYASQFDASIKTYESALSFCRTNGVDVLSQHCLPCMSWVLLRLGEWKKALEVCKEISDDPQGYDAAKATANLVLAIIKAHRGENKSALQHIQQAQLLSEREHLAYAKLLLPWAKALVFENSNESAEVEQQYQEMLQIWQSSQDQHDVLVALLNATAYYGEQANEEALNRCAQIFSTISKNTANPEAVGGLAFALGEMAHLRESYAESNEHYDQAIRHFEDLSTPVQKILALYKKGVTLAQLPEERDSTKKTLQTALSEAKTLGMRPLAAKIELALAPLQKPVKQVFGNEKSKSEPVGVPLTRRQMEILLAVAEGLSNKEIASKLYLSTRTVDMHVGNILDRLNCRSRAEAVKVAAEQGMLDI